MVIKLNFIVLELARLILKTQGEKFSKLKKL